MANKWNEKEQGAKRRRSNQGTRGTARTQPTASNPNKNTKSTDTNRNSGRTAAAKPAPKAAPKAAPKQTKPKTVYYSNKNKGSKGVAAGVKAATRAATNTATKKAEAKYPQTQALRTLSRQAGARNYVTGRDIPLAMNRPKTFQQTVTPLEQMKADAVAGPKYWGARASIPSKKLTAEQQKKKNQQTAKQSGFNARARRQTLSSYDQKLSQGKQFQIQQAKQRYDEAKEKGDRAGMEKAHREAENLRYTAGYSGGATGNERIAPKLSQDDYNRLNASGRLAMTQARMTRDRATTEDEIARADRRIEEILNAPGYRNNRLSAAETGKGWSYGPDGRRMWSGTKEQNRADAAPGLAALRSVGEGAAGGLLYAGQTASRATRDKFERENIDKWIADEANYNQAKSDLEFIRSYKEQFGVVPEGYNEMQAQIAYNNAVQARAQLQRIRGDVDSLYFDPTVAERLGLPTTRDETLGERLLRQAAEDQAEATEGMNGVERFVTNALISTGQSVPGMALGLIPGVGPALGLGVLGAQAGGSRAYDLRQQGVTAEDAYRAGFISGGIEALTEKLPLENFAQIVKGKGGKSALRNVLEQAGLEGSEEAVSYVGNYIADVAQHNPDAHFSWLELLENAGMGAIGGAAFGVVGGFLSPGHAVSPMGAQSEEIQEQARSAAAQVEAVQDAETQIRTVAAQRLREDAQAYNEMVKAGVWSDAEQEMVKASLDQRYAEIAGQNVGQTSPVANQAPLTQVFEDGMQRNRGRAERAPAASVPTPLSVNETPVSVNPVEQAEQMTAEALRATDAEMARRDAVAQLQAETPPITYERSGLPPTSFLGAAIDARREARAKAEAEAQVRRDQETARQNRVAAEQQTTTNGPAEISTTIRRNEQAQVQQPTSRLEGLASTFGESGAASLRTIGGKMVIGQGAFVRDFTDVYNQVLGGRSERQVSRPAGMSDANYFAAVTAAQNDRQTGWDLDILKASKAAGRNVNAGVDWRDQYVRQMDRKTARTVDGLAKALGVKVVFAEKGSVLTAGGTAANAEITGNVVRIEKGNPNPVRMLIGHELTHRMQDVSPETYRAFRDYAMSVPGSMEALERTVSLYQKAGAFRAQDNARQMAMDEVTADFAGSLLENSEQLQEFIRRNYENRTMLEVIRDFFRDLAAKLTGRQKARADEAVRLLEEAIKGASARVNGKGASARVNGMEGVRFSITPQTDADYLAAVERGDMETAQRMVDEAAKAAGYTIKAYHGTPNGTFHVFRDWSYFTEDRDYADVYQNQGASSNGYKQTADNPKTYGVYLEPKNAFDTRIARDRKIFQNEFYRQWGNGAPLSERGLPDWTDGDDLIEFFDEEGYDYDAFYLDEGGTGGYGDEVHDRGVSIVIKDSAQVKSADPVTYDDDGNVIPLSERFDAETGDIRYSIGTHDSEGYALSEGQREYFKDSQVTDERGRLLRVYHGTPAGGFTEFREANNTGYFFTRSRSLAQTYSGGGDEFAPERAETWEDAQTMAKEYGLELFEENGGWTLKHSWGEEYFGPNDLDEAADFILKEVEGERMEYVGYLNLTNPLVVEGHGAYWNKISGVGADGHRDRIELWEDLGKYHIRLSDEMDPEKLRDMEEIKASPEELREILTDYYTEETADRIIDDWIEAGFSPQDFELLSDADGHETRERTTLEWVWDAVDGGYDGVIFHNIIDEGRYGGADEVTDVYVALNSNQFKSVNNWNPTDNEDIRFSIGTEGYDRARLMRENQDIRDRLETWRRGQDQAGQTKVSDKTISDLTARLANEYRTNMPRDEIAMVIRKIYDSLGKGASFDKVYQDANALAARMVEQASDEEESLYTAYQDLRSYIRGAEILVSKDLKDQIPGYNALRQSMMGRATLKNGEETNIDTVFSDLAGKWPEFFDQEIDTTQAAKLERIGEVLQDIYNREETEAPGLPEGYLATEILASYFDSPAVRASMAQKAGARSEAMRARHKERYDAALEKARAQKEKELKRKSERYLTAKRKNSQKQKERELRAKIQRHCGRLSAKLKSGTDKQHVPEVMQRIVATALDSINLGSGFTLVYDENGKAKRVKDGSGETTKRTEAFEDLRKFYQQIITADPDEDLAGEMPEIISKIVVSEELPKMIDGIIGMRDTPIANLGKADLDKIWETVKAIETTISTYDKALGQARFETISEPAFAIQDYAAPKKDRRNYAGGMKHVDRLLNVGMLKPIYFLYRLGDGGKMIWKMIEDAQSMNIRYLDEIRAYQEEHFKPGTAKRLEKEKHTFNFDGQKIELTTAQLINLYNLRKREQAEGHILEGGFRPDQIVKGIRDVTPAAPWHFTAEQIGEMLNVVAGDAELVRIADAMMDGIKPQAVHGNAASMEVYGIKKYRERNYWPIESDKNQTQTDIKNEAVSKTVAGSGFAKATQKGANNAIILRSAFDVYDDHVVGMAKYAAWLGPLENLRRILNFRYKDETGHMGGGVKEMLTKIIGKDGPGYYKKLMDDLNAGIKATSDNPFQQFIGSYKAAAIAGNIRVVAQQPTSIMRALAEVDPQDFLLGMAEAGPGQWENEIKKYAPIAIWKDWGYFTADTGRQMRNIFWGDDNVLQTANNFIMNNRVFSPGAADAVTWTAIWNAIKRETKRTRKELDPNSEEFMYAVRDRFNEVINLTQVVDGIPQRSQLMRSENDVTKMATSFMGEPTTTYNMATFALHKARTSTGAERGKAMRHLARTTVALATSIALNAAAQSLVDAMRDDDKDEGYWEKFFQAFFGLEGETRKDRIKSAILNGNLGAGMNPLTYIPFIKDVVSKRQGYKVTRMDMDIISRVMDSYDAVVKAMNGEGKKTKKNAWINFIAECSRFLGVPVANIKRDILSGVSTVFQVTGNYRLQYELEKFLYNIEGTGNFSEFAKLAYLAKRDGDTEAYEAIRADLIANGPKTEKDVDKKIAEFEKKAVTDTEEYQTALAQKTDAYHTMLEASQQYQEMDEELQGKVQDKLDSYAQYQVLGQSMDVDGSAFEKVQTAEASGVPAVDWAVLTVLKGSRNNYEENGKTITVQDQMIETIDQMGGTDEEKSARYRTLYDSDKNNPWA